MIDNRWLIEEIERQGHSTSNLDGVQRHSDPVAVQAIIDSFDPMPYAQDEATERVNAAAGEARSRYITVEPGQDATYELKRSDSMAFKDAGYPEGAIGDYPMVAAEAQAIGSTGQVAADYILATADQWIQLAALIEGKRRGATEEIKAATDWQQCSVIADGVVSELEAI